MKKNIGLFVVFAGLVAAANVSCAVGPLCYIYTGPIDRDFAKRVGWLRMQAFERAGSVEAAADPFWLLPSTTDEEGVCLSSLQSTYESLRCNRIVLDALLKSIFEAGKKNCLNPEYATRVSLELDQVCGLVAADFHNLAEFMVAKTGTDSYCVGSYRLVARELGRFAPR